MKQTGWLNIFNFYLKMNSTLGQINTAVSLVLIALVIITLVDSVRKWVELLKTVKPVGLNTDVLAVCQSTAATD